MVLYGAALFTLASIGCALAQSLEQLMVFRALQGVSTGAGMVVSRAVVRDLFTPVQAQKVLSQMTLFFGIAPALAPVAGGWLFEHAGWHAIFLFLAASGAAIWVVCRIALPESLHASQRQPFNGRNLMRGYRELLSDRRFTLLALGSVMPFNGLFLYIMSAPQFLGGQLHLAPRQFAWLFVMAVGGVMAGAWTSGRLAGRMPARRQVRWGFAVMALAGGVNVVANALWQPDVHWSLWPIAIYAFGSALAMPAISLMLLDLYPQRRGLASSLHAVVLSAVNGFVAGVIAPLVMDDASHLAVASLSLMGLGWLALWCLECSRKLPCRAAAPLG